MRGVSILFLLILSVASAIAQPYRSNLDALVIPVEFSDIKFVAEDPYTHVENLFNKSGYNELSYTPSVSSYFRDNLIGTQYSISFEISPVASLSKELSYYGENFLDDTQGMIYDYRIRDMLDDATRAVNDDVDFSRYNVIFLYCAGHSEAEGGGDDALWPMFVDISNKPITLDGANIQGYGCFAELRGASGTLSSGIGTICHEIGHVLGLVDLYDVDGELNGRSNGMWGTLSLMGYGCYNNKGMTPPYLNAIERELLGLEGEEVILNATNTLEPIHKNGRFIRINTLNEGEYYLLEVREEQGWDSYIGGEGLLIYHIDKSNSHAGRLTASTRWRLNLVNSFSEHECASVVKALPSAVNVKEVFFPGVGNVTSFATLTNPPFTDWFLRGVGVKLQNIRINGDGSVSFDVSLDNDEILPKAEKIKYKVSQSDLQLSWSSSKGVLPKWCVRWREEGESFAAENTMMVEDTSCRIFPIKSGVEYFGEIFYMGLRSNGDTSSFRFKGKEVTSPFPYIDGLDGKYRVGDSATLSLYNLSEVAQSVVWYLNGEILPNGVYTFHREGKNEIMVKIKYRSDGSEEIIKRYIIIEDADEAIQ